MSDKKRRVVSYENMDEVLAAAFAEKYPKGQSDYLTDLAKYTKPDGSVFYAVSLETDDCIALIKIQIDVDAPEDIEYYLCGPPMMAKTVLDLLHSLGVEDDMIRFDNFGG